jgi:serine/threonine-protein kinase HipA
VLVHALALKLFAGKHATKTYPTTVELLAFGSKVCAVSAPAKVLLRIARGMRQTLQDERVPRELLTSMREAWASGLEYAESAAGADQPMQGRNDGGMTRH